MTLVTLVVRLTMVVLVVTLVAGPALVLGQAGDVNKVLADMRAALGGADKVAAVKTLTAVGKSARTNSNGATTEGDLEWAMELPDKYVARTVLANMGTMSVYRNAGFNGTGVINEMETPPNLMGGGVCMDDGAAYGKSAPTGSLRCERVQSETAERFHLQVREMKTSFRPGCFIRNYRRS